MARDHIDLALKLGLDAVVLSTNIKPGKLAPIKRISENEWRDDGNAIHYLLKVMSWSP